MSRTIAANLNSGLTLSSTTDSPIYIDPGVTIGNSNGPALIDSTPFHWAMTNATSALVTGANFGVSLASTATVVNDGSITASYTAGNGLSFTPSTDRLTLLGAGVYIDGGGVSNSASGAISGVVGVALGGAGSVVNAGSIVDPQTSAGAGVVLAAGGTVTNEMGGDIAGGNYGILSTGAASVGNQGTIGGSGIAGLYLADGGNVSNQTNGAMYGGEAGIVVQTAGGTVTNAGLIDQQDPYQSQSFAMGGVLLLAGGTVNNDGGSIIGAASYGVDIANAAGTVINSGLIESFRIGGGAGVLLLSGGSVNNAGTVDSFGYGVLSVDAAASVTNTGQIASYVDNVGAGVALLQGGVLTNGVGGIITGGFIGVQFGTINASTAAPQATLDNQGIISASNGSGDGTAVWMHGPGVVINQAGATIQGGSNGTIVGGPLDGSSTGPFGIVACYQTTVINYGSIGSGTYNAALYQQGTIGPKQFAFEAANPIASNTIANLIEMAPGASFGGVVKATDGSALATLELLSGASAGSISSFGTVTINGSYYQGYLGFGTVNLDNGARWSLGGTVAAGTTLSFAPGGSGALTLLDPSLVQGTIADFAAGDTIGLAGITVTGSSFAGGMLTLTEATGGPISLNLTGSFTPDAFHVTNTGGAAEITDVACFAAGTAIRTGQGMLPVERLRPGMQALTLHGAMAEIVWIGHREVDCRDHPDPAVVCPVRIQAGAFGPGLPSRDLRLSPDHAVFVEGVLIPVQYLINGGTIRQMTVPSVTYYHVELAEHDVILAEELPVESYLDTGDRANFSNAGGAVRLFPDFSARMWEMAGCAPRVMSGAVLQRVRQALDRPGRGSIWMRLNNRYTYY